MLFGVKVRGENTVTENLVEQLGLGCIAVVFSGPRLPVYPSRERQECRISRNKKLKALCLGRNGGQEMKRGENCVLKNTGQTRIAQNVRGELEQEVLQDDEPARADSGGGIVQEGKEDGDKERPLFTDQFFLYPCWLVTQID